LHLSFMDADGGNVRAAVPPVDEPDHDPDWSPDGKFITFHRGPGGEFVIVADLDGNILGEIKSTVSFIRLPSWH
jgi:Tol biopolymer transport system component